MRPVEVARDEPHAAGAPNAANGRCVAGEVQRRAKPLSRDGARDAERPTDILLVDHVVGQGDLAAETCCETMRLGMPADELLG